MASSFKQTKKYAPKISLFLSFSVCSDPVQNSGLGAWAEAWTPCWLPLGVSVSPWDGGNYAGEGVLCAWVIRIPEEEEADPLQRFGIPKAGPG